MPNRKSTSRTKQVLRKLLNRKCRRRQKQLIFQMNYDLIGQKVKISYLDEDKYRCWDLSETLTT